MNWASAFAGAHTRLLPATLAALTAFTLTGCGGKLIPRDLKDYLAAELKTDRRNVDVTIPFRTTIIRRIPAVNLNKARDAERELVMKFLEYCRRDGVSDFQNDSLMFLVRLDTDPDVNIKWHSTATDAREVLDGKMEEGEFFDRCQKEEHWAEELG